MSFRALKCRKARIPTGCQALFSDPAAASVSGVRKPDRKKGFTKPGSYDNISAVRGISAVGSAQHWQCWGQEFESPMLHNRGRLDFQGLPLLFLENTAESCTFWLSKAVRKALWHKGLKAGTKGHILYQNFSHFLRKFEYFVILRVCISV